MSTLAEFYEGGPNTWNEAFPPMCLTTHWDPTSVSDHILPRFQASMPLDPRPSTRICYRYSSIDNTVPIQVDASAITDAPIYPPGGAAGKGFPYQQYSANIEKEADVFRMREPLTKCSERRYIPEGGHAPTYVGERNVPGANLENTTTLSPQVSQVTFQAGCRNQDDYDAWNRSSRLFSNPTRYDRTTMVPKNLPKADSRYSLAC